MKVYYDPSDSNQVQAIYTGNTKSTAWSGFPVVPVMDKTLIETLRLKGRDAQLVLDADGNVTGIIDRRHPGDKQARDDYEATKKFADDRKMAYFDEIGVGEMLEALIEKDRGDATKFNAVVTKIDAIKTRFPKPA